MVDLESVRQRLVARRAELRGRARSVRADLRRERDPLSADFAEQVTQRENDDVLGAIGEFAATELRQIQVALRRIDEGTYANCDACGQDIGAARLEAVPYADRCASCAGETRARVRNR